jgi:hypothetical protein
MTASLIFSAVRSGRTATVMLPTIYTRYCFIRTSTYFSCANESRRSYFDQQGKGSWRFSALLAAAAVAVATGSTSLNVSQQHALTLCEQQPYRAKSENDDEEDDEDFHDPMSSYALAAILREMKTQHDEQQLKEQSSGENTVDKDGTRTSTTVNTSSSSVQATSSSNDPLPLNPSEAFPDGNLPILSEAEAKIEEATRKAKQHSGGLKIFSGNGNMSLALEICRHLGVNLGKATVGRFADGEVNVVIHENVRGKDVYIVQPTCPPVNDNIMELLLMVSTLRRSSARRITVVIPYYGYARQDRKMQVMYPLIRLKYFDA